MQSGKNEYDIYAQHFFSLDFSSCLLNWIKQLKVAKTRPWKLPFCAEQSLSVTSWTRPACVAKVSNNVTSRPFLFFIGKERTNTAAFRGALFRSKENIHKIFTKQSNQACSRRVRVHFALRPRKRDGLLGTGTRVGAWGGGGGGTKEWRLDRGYRPKKTGETVDRRQNNGSVKAVSPRHCAATSALRNCCFNGQSHKDNVVCTAVEEQLQDKEVQLSQPSSISLLMISSGLTWGSSSTSLLFISPGSRGGGGGGGMLESLYPSFVQKTTWTAQPVL